MQTQTYTFEEAKVAFPNMRKDMVASEAYLLGELKRLGAIVCSGVKIDPITSKDADDECVYCMRILNEVYGHDYYLGGE